MPQTKTRIVCTQLQISSWFFRNRKPEFKDGSQRTDFAGSLSNGVDDLENFTSEMEWSFFCSRRFLLCFFKLVQLRINTACVSAGVDSCMNSCR